MRGFLRKIDKILKPGKLGKILNPNIYPNNLWYREHMVRNFDMVCLGDARYVGNVFFSKGIKGFNWSLRGQNLQWDFNVLKHFFSILKPDGMAVFPLTGNFVYDLTKNPDIRRYYIHMMPYYLSSSRMMKIYIRICKRIPLLAIRPSDLLLKRCRGEGYSQRKSTNLSMAENLINEICLFCQERDIIPVFVMLQTDEFKSLFIGKRCMYRVIKEKDYNFDTIINIAEEWKQMN